MWIHDERPGKITLDPKWTGVRTGHMTFKGVAAQGGYTNDELKRLMNRR